MASQSATAPIRVLACDCQPLFRDGMVRTIRQRAQFQLIGEVADGRAALDAIFALEPDVAVLQLPLPSLDGRRIARAVRREGLATQVVLMAAPGRPEVAYSALADGAVGVITREASPEQLCEAITAAARGDTFLSPQIQADIAAEIRTRAGADRPRLTDRERQILRRIADGESVPAIAGALHLAPATVKTHLAHVYERLGVRERAAAVAEAMRRGLLE